MEKHFSLESFGKFLEAQAVRHPEVLSLATRGSAGVLYRNAYEIYGDNDKLEDLAPATQDERERLGYSRNEPLKRTGELLRDNMEEHHDFMFAGIGSSEPVALYSELGDANRPARPVYKTALEESMGEVIDMISLAFQTALGVHKVEAKVLKDRNFVQSDREVASIAEQFEVFSGPDFGGFE